MPTTRRCRRVAGAAAVALAAAGCGTATVPPPQPPDAALSRAETVGTNPPPAPPDVRTTFERRVERFVVRVRGAGCGGAWTGSGFAISPTQFITNRHVVAGADELEATTYDGRILKGTVAYAAAPPRADVAVVTVDGRLPSESESTQPRVGSQVVAVGFPRGGKLTFSDGEIVGRRTDPEGSRFKALRIDAFVTHGNSGGPLVDQDGRVLGIVYRLDDNPAYRLALPIGALKDLVGGMVPAKSLACE